MDANERFKLITQHTEEVLVPEELQELLKKEVPLKHYIGFEISGKVHLGTGLMTGMKIADFQKAGVHCTCYLATWHAWINNKLGGDLDTIRTAAAFFGEVLKASIDVMGGDSSKVTFITGDELYHHNDDFWERTIDIAKHTTLSRALRSISVLGREEGDNVPLAFLFYPAMQAADIFALGVNIAHAGIDQRKAHVIAREAALKIRKPLSHKGVQYKPIAIHHPLLAGLQKPAVWPLPAGQESEVWAQSMKMSKSVQGSAVFVLDTPEEIRKKVSNAFCPEGETVYNPIMNWVRTLLFAKAGYILRIDRPQKFGGPLEFDSYAELEDAVKQRSLHPMDLKKAVGEALVELLAPVRAKFEHGKMKEMKEAFDKIAVTR